MSNERIRAWDHAEIGPDKIRAHVILTVTGLGKEEGESDCDLLLRWRADKPEKPSEWLESWTNHHLGYYSNEREHIASQSPDPERMLRALNQVLDKALVEYGPLKGHK